MGKHWDREMEEHRDGETLGQRGGNLEMGRHRDGETMTWGDIETVRHRYGEIYRQTFQLIGPIRKLRGK